MPSRNDNLGISINIIPELEEVNRDTTSEVVFRTQGSFLKHGKYLQVVGVQKIKAVIAKSS